MHTNFSSENPRREALGGLDVYVRIRLRWVLKSMVLGFGLDLFDSG